MNLQVNASEVHTQGFPLHMLTISRYLHANLSASMAISTRPFLDEFTGECMHITSQGFPLPFQGQIYWHPCQSAPGLIYTTSQDMKLTEVP